MAELISTPPTLTERLFGVLANNPEIIRRLPPVTETAAPPPGVPQGPWEQLFASLLATSDKGVRNLISALPEGPPSISMDAISAGSPVPYAGNPINVAQTYAGIPITQPSLAQVPVMTPSMETALDEPRFASTAQIPGGGSALTPSVADNSPPLVLAPALGQAPSTLIPSRPAATGNPLVNSLQSIGQAINRASTQTPSYDPYTGQFTRTPRPSDLEVLMGLGAALLGGGGTEGFLYRASDISRYQQLEAERQAVLRHTLAKDSPRAQQQRGLYQNQMNLEYSRFMDAFHKSGASATDPEWVQALTQLDAKYTALGLEPPPTPFEFANPELNRDLAPDTKLAIDSIRRKHGDEAATDAALLASPSVSDTTKGIIAYGQKLDAINAATSSKNYKKRFDEIKALEKQDLEYYKQIGAASKQFKMSYDTRQVSPSASYAKGERAIREYYSNWRADLDEDGLSKSGRFRKVFNALGAPTQAPKDFNAFVDEVVGRTVYEDSLDSLMQDIKTTRGNAKGTQYVHFPARTHIPLSSLSEQQKSSATRISSEADLEEPTAFAEMLNRSVLVYDTRTKTYGWIDPPELYR